METDIKLLENTQKHVLKGHRKRKNIWLGSAKKLTYSRVGYGRVGLREGRRRGSVAVRYALRCWKMERERERI